MLSQTAALKILFQSPRSGQICSNLDSLRKKDLRRFIGFNPLDRVKFVQITMKGLKDGKGFKVLIP